MGFRIEKPGIHFQDQTVMNSKEKLHKGQEGLSGPSPLRSDGSLDIQAGKLVCVSTG
jgi:hypothetical protein